MGRPKYAKGQCNGNSCDSILKNNKQHSTSSLWISPPLSTSNIIKDDTPIPESVDNTPPSHIVTIPTHLNFPKSKNVELRTMRMIYQPTLAGYNPFRGDFEVEYNNNAENIVCIAGCLNYVVNLERDNQTKQTIKPDKLLTELQVVLVECYNSRLKERQKRKEIIKNYGLMNRKAVNRWNTKLQNSLGKSNTKKIIRVLPLLPIRRGESLISSIQNVYEKRAQLNKLIFYRSHYGVTTNLTMKIFEDHKNNDCKNDRVDICNLLTPPTAKRNRKPLQIFHLPRYKELTALEADFCRLNNLEPKFFLDTKDHLIADCTKNNGMLLKRARKLVKIDVNKTRKIFDLFMEQGYIWPAAK